MARWGWWLGGAAILAAVMAPPSAADVGDVPAAFAPFEPLVGGWKGSGIPAANRLKGWPERHAWAWKFAGGKPVGLTVTLEGNKTLARGGLAYDEATKSYRLEGTDPDGKAVAYLGTLDEKARTLTLRRDGERPGDDQISIKWFDDRPRCVVTIGPRRKGAAALTPAVTVGLTKEGETFAAGGAAASGPKCVVTGGLATMAVTYGGKSYPLCCTGCRDEFNDDPEKYVAKLARLAAPKGDTPEAKGESAGTIGAPDPAVEAASLLRMAQALERQKKAVSALDHYRRIVKEHPGTPQAEAAAGRIKALEGK